MHLVDQSNSRVFAGLKFENLTLSFVGNAFIRDSEVAAHDRAGCVLLVGLCGWFYVSHFKRMLPKRTELKCWGVGDEEEGGKVEDEDSGKEDHIRDDQEGEEEEEGDQNPNGAKLPIVSRCVMTAVLSTMVTLQPFNANDTHHHKIHNSGLGL